MTLLPKTDVLTVKRHVRFTPESGHCAGALVDVCYVPIADIRHLIRSTGRRARLACWGR